MLPLTSPQLLWVVGLAAATIAVLIVVLWTRAHQRLRGVRGVLAIVGRTGLVGLLVALTGFGLFLSVNNSYGFYTSWRDLLGLPSDRPDGVSLTGLTPGQGALRKLSVTGTAAGTSGQVLVWLPPGYNDPANAATRYPVLFFLPGQTNPERFYAHLDFGRTASRLVAAGQVKPFIAVFPPIVIAPPRDTECIDVVGGPRAESWLTKDVTTAVQQNVRAFPPGQRWGIVGWSTGGFCAANLAMRNPTLFAAAVPMGATYIPYLDRTTGDLFAGDQDRMNHNTPLWLYGHVPAARTVKMYMITGRQDRSAWPQTKMMAAAAKGNPRVVLRTFPVGGHNYHNYVPELPAAYAWLTRENVL